MQKTQHEAAASLQHIAQVVAVAGHNLSMMRWALPTLVGQGSDLYLHKWNGIVTPDVPKTHPMDYWNKTKGRGKFLRKDHSGGIMEKWKYQFKSIPIRCINSKYMHQVKPADTSIIY